MIISVVYLLVRCLLGCLGRAGAAPSVQGYELLVLRHRTGLAPPDRPGPLRAERPAVAGSTVAIGSTQPLGQGVRGDTRDPTAPPAVWRASGPHSRRGPGRPPTAAADPRARDPHRDRQSHMGTRGFKANWPRLGHPIAASTVWQILHDAGIDPAPRRPGPTWKQFLTTLSIIAADFVVHVDTVPLRRLYVLIVIETAAGLIWPVLPASPNGRGRRRPPVTS